MKNVYKFFITTVWLMHSLISYSQVQPGEKNTFSLAEARDYGVEFNLNIRNSQLDVAIYRQKAWELISQGFPKIYGEVSYQHNFELPTSLVPAEFFGGPEGEFAEIKFGTEHNMSAGLSIDQLIIDGRYFVGLKANKMLVELANTQHQKNEADIRFSITEAYYTALVALENIEIIENIKNAVEKILNETRAMYENGFVEKLDVQRLELSYANLSTEARIARRQAGLALNILKFQMGYPIEDTIILTESLQHLTDDSYDNVEIEFTPSNRLEYTLLDMRKNLKRMDILQQRAGYFPSLYGFFSYKYDAQRNKFNFFDSDLPWYRSGMLGLSLQVPIWDGNTRRAIIQQTKLDHEKRENELKQFEISAYIECKNALTALKNARETLKLQTDNLKLAEEIYNTTIVKFREGVGSSLEVSNAESELNRTRSNYIKALYDFLKAKNDLDKATGNYY